MRFICFTKWKMNSLLTTLNDFYMKKMVGGEGDFCKKLNYWFQRYQMVRNVSLQPPMGCFSP